MNFKEMRQQVRSVSVNHLVVDGKRLPCSVKAVVYQAGQAGGLRITTTNPSMMSSLLQDQQQQQEVREKLGLQIDAELAANQITYGVDVEAIQSLVAEFVEAILGGTESTVTGKVAEGVLPEAGRPGFLQYHLNPDGLPFMAMGRAGRLSAIRKVHLVKEGDLIVERHPPESGSAGTNVRGESLPSTDDPREVVLEPVAGPGTSIEGDRIVAAREGVVREDRRGGVRVVQELEVVEVNAASKDLPKTGVAGANFRICRGVRTGFGVFTSEDVFVGTRQEAATLDAASRARARNLFVRGQVTGNQLPAQYLSGEMEALEEGEQNEIKSQLAKSQIEVDEVFGAREVLNRNVSAGAILVQEHCFMSSLEADSDVLVDGNVVGGMVSFGGRLQVSGDLGNPEGTITRIRLESESRGQHDRQRLQDEMTAERARLQTRTEALDAHQKHMDQYAKKSQYWAALMADEQRPPRGATESRILKEYLEAAREKRRLEQEVADSKSVIRDQDLLLQKGGEEEEEEGQDLQITVKGTVYPGVTVETIRPLDARDAELTVQRKTAKGGAVPLKEIADELASAVEGYLAPRREALEDRQQALDQMFEGRQKRPEAPQVPNRRFQAEVLILGRGDTSAVADTVTLPMEGLLCVYARNPQTFYLTVMGKIKEPLRHVALQAKKADQGFVFEAAQGAEIPPWQQDTEILEELEMVRVLGESARDLLLD